MADSVTNSQPLRIPSSVFVEVVRLLAVALGSILGWEVAGGSTAPGPASLLGTGLGAGTGYLVGGLAGRGLGRVLGRYEERVDRTPAATLFLGAALAAVAGLIGTLIGLVTVALLPGPYGWPVLGLLAWLGIYVGYTTGSRKGEELLSSLRRPDALAEATTSPTAGVHEPALLLLDSSAAIDGRLLAVAQTGFLPGRLGVPTFVVDELQGIADASDETRRRRGRRGLEALAALRAEADITVEVLPEEVPEYEEVDAKLLALAVRRNAGVLTVDDNLAQAASLRGVRTLSLHRLAQAVQPVLVPGEVIHIRVSKEGRDAGQGIGFLDDGTMVVVSDAAAFVGRDAHVSIVSSVQTSRGRMFFGSLAA